MAERAAILKLLGERLGFDPATTPESTPVAELGCDSLDMVEAAIGLEELLDIELTDDDLALMRTIGLCADVAGAKAAGVPTRSSHGSGGASFETRPEAAPQDEGRGGHSPGARPREGGDPPAASGTSADGVAMSTAAAPREEEGGRDG